MTDPSVPERPAAAQLACPSCAAPFVLGTQRCGTCGLILTGPLAAALWNVDVELATLSERRTRLLETLRVSSGLLPSPAPAPAPPTTGTERSGPPGTAPLSPAPPPTAPEPVRVPAAAYAAATSAAAARASAQAAPPYPQRLAPASPSTSPQSLLLTLGVLLILVAGTVFVAVAWKSLGVYGQFGVLLVVIAIFAAIASYCDRRRLRSSAEAFAILTVGLLGVALFAAYRLDFAGVESTDPRYYAGGAFVAVAIATSLLHGSARRVLTYPVTTVGTAWAACIAWCGVSSPLSWSLGLVVGWALLASPLLVWNRAVIEALLDPALPTSVDEDDSSVQRSRLSGLPYVAPLWPPALASGIAGVVVASVLVASATAASGPLAVATALVVLVLASLGAALRVDRPFASLAPEVLPFAVTLWVVAGAEVAALLNNLDGPVLVVTAAVCTVLLVLLLVVRSERTQSWSPQAGCVVVGCGVAAVLLEPLRAGQDGSAGSAFAFALLAVGAAALAVAEPPWRAGAELLGSAAALIALGFGADAVGADLDGAAVAYAAAGIVLGAAMFLRMAEDEHTEELAFGIATVVAFAVSIGLAATARVPELASADDSRVALLHSTGILMTVLGMAATVAFLYALVPGRGLAALVGAPLAISAIWVSLADEGTADVEAYTLSAALVTALVGVGVYFRDPDASSWTVCGVPVGLALLPSAVLSASTDSALRLVWVLAASAVLLLVGLAVRWAALVALPAAALVIVAVLQLGGFVVGLPQWFSFGVAGLVLVIAGVRYERNLADARAVNAWFVRMR